MIIVIVITIVVVVVIVIVIVTVIVIIIVFVIATAIDNVPLLLLIVRGTVNGGSTSGLQWALPPPPPVNGLHPPPHCIALIFVCPSTTDQVQCG